MKCNCCFLLLSFLCASFFCFGQQHPGKVRFIQNNGQIKNGSTAGAEFDVFFQIEGQPVYLRKDGITFQVNNYSEVKNEVHEKIEELEHSEKGLGEHNEHEWESALMRKEKVKMQQISLTFLESNNNVKIEKSDPSEDYLNYYLAHCSRGVKGVKMYDYVKYKNIYEGIDIHYYGNEMGELEYDFLIAPFANPNQIKLKWNGAEDVLLGKNGQLEIRNKVQNFEESLPLVYQLIESDTVHVEAKYKLESNKDGSFLVSYELGEYDQSYELIIDPWVTNYGGEASDIGSGLTTDSEGNVLITGRTNSFSGIAEDGFSEVKAGMTDAFLVKFNEAGERLWGTYYGGDSTDAGESLVTDAENNVFMSGVTLSVTGISESGFQSEFGGAVYDWIFAFGDMFLVKFNSSGERVWATYYGGEAGEGASDTFVGVDGSVYLSGRTGSLEDIASLDGFQTTNAGGGGYFPDGFLVKFTNDGDREWATYYGGGDQDEINGVATDQENNIFICGTTTSYAGISTPMAHQEVLGGMKDAFLAKFNSSGDRLWSTYFGGNSTDLCWDIDCDTLNNVYIAGSTESTDGIAFEGCQMEHGNPEGVNARDAFLGKFDTEGTRVWATYFGGDLNDYALSVDVDKETNNVAISGDTYSLNFPISDCAIQQELIGTENAYVTQFQPLGDLYCSSYFGADHEENNKLAFGSCYLYVVGTTPIGVATPGSHQEIFGGSTDAFLAQVYKSSCGIEELTATIGNTYQDITDCNTCDGEISIQVSREGCGSSSSYISYIWSTGDTYINSTDTLNSLTGLCAGEYWVYVELNCGISDTLYFDLGSELDLVEAEYEAENVCLGELMTFTNLSNTEDGSIVRNNWNFGDSETSSDENPNHIFDTSGIYIVMLEVENSSGCSDTVYHEIEVFPTYHMEEEFIFCEDFTLVLPDGTIQTVEQDEVFEFSFESINGCDSNLVWNVIIEPNYVVFDTVFSYKDSSVTFPDGEEIIVTDDGEHTSFLRTDADCDSTIVTTVIVDDFVFHPPNIFTPDGDNSNNTFFFPNEWVRTFSCVIVNRWGAQVFEFNSIEDQWDGRNARNGEECPDGVYFYTYKGTYVSGNGFQGQGTVQLIR